MLQPQPDNVPAQLKRLPRWVAWKGVLNAERGKIDKIPLQPSGRLASPASPKTWTTFDSAFAYFKQNAGKPHVHTSKKGERIEGPISGVGFVLNGDGLVAIDLDHALDADGNPAPWAHRIVDLLDTYTEVSPSGTGLRLICRGDLPDGRRKRGDVEAYSDKRFVTITGHVFGEHRPIRDAGDDLLDFHRRFLGPNGTRPAAGSTSSDSTGSVSLDDSELIQRASEAANGHLFSRLWSGGWTGYPSQSEADQALCNLLAFWTGRDTARIDRLFRQSGLFRPKWDRNAGGGQSYGQKTIAAAIAGCRETYQPERATTRGETAASHAPAAEDPTFHLTDLGNAERFARDHAGRVRYCHPWKTWFCWDGRRWKEDSTGEVKRLARETIRRMYKEAADIPDETIRKSVAKHAIKSESEARIRAMLELAKSEPGIPILPEDFDQDPWLFNIENGTLDLRTGRLLPHRREHLITKLAPVDYDPNAECPRFKSFLERIFGGNRDTIRFVQRAIGYTLTGSTSEQCFFLAHGTGLNGKTTLLKTLRQLLGDYGEQADFSTFLEKKGEGPRNDLAKLRGSRFVAAVEADQGRRLSESTIKALTGGDEISCRFLHREYFTYQPEFKIWLATNHKPIVKGQDHAIWRRVKLIPFKVQIPRDEVDPDLSDKLKAELPGILNWALQGLAVWREQGLGTAEEVQQATEAYREEMDRLAGFISNRCFVDPQVSASASTLYQAYSEWCEEVGEEAVSKIAFGRMLGERGFTSKKDRRGGRVWSGIALLDISTRRNNDGGYTTHPPSFSDDPPSPQHIDNTQENEMTADDGRYFQGFSKNFSFISKNPQTNRRHPPSPVENSDKSSNSHDNLMTADDPVIRRHLEDDDGIRRHDDGVDAPLVDDSPRIKVLI